ncbi:MAG: hypothetical protein HOH74_32480 [Gemmatimonadetes bacterium]|jgi:hypothetical protein|nr:hypothetical protein [Gemmatimonadota bacterium]
MQSSGITRFVSYRVLILSFIGLSLLTRLSLHDSNVFFFDGDEAVVGLMAIDILDGSFPLYFYGQNYGLAGIEALLVSMGILVFGISMLAIKIPMLALWMSAVFLLGLSCAIILKNQKALLFLFMANIVLTPAWLVWSMKARGGYLTSFFLASLAVYLLVSRDGKLRLREWAGVGAVVAVIYEAQPLWVPTVIPIILFFLVKGRPAKENLIRATMSLAAGLSVPLAVFHYIRASAEGVWPTPAINLADRWNLETLLQLPGTLIASLGGNYYLSTTYSPGNSLFSIVFLSLFAVGAGIAVSHIWRDRQVGISSVLLASSLLSLSGFIVSAEARYLLPFTGLALLTVASAMASVEIGSWLKKALVGMLLITAAMGASSLTNFAQFSFINMAYLRSDPRPNNDLAAMEKLIATLDNEGVKYVLSDSETMQYQLSYMTRNRLLAVGRADRCRIRDNVPKIREAYENHSDEVALVDYNFYGRYAGMIPLIDDELFYLIHPQPKTLKQAQFFLD